MATPFISVDATGTIQGGGSDKFSPYVMGHLHALSTTSADVSSPNASHATIITSPGAELTASETSDQIQVQLLANTTYTFALRGTVDGIEDPYLTIRGPHGNIIASDDDGGYGRTSLITITTTQAGTYTLNAASWYTLAGYPAGTDTGGYTISQWTIDAAHDAGDSIGTATSLTTGTTYSGFESAGDVDVYSVSVTEGMFYQFSFAGGTMEAGLQLVDADGVVVSNNVSDGTLNYLAQDSGTYYLVVAPAAQRAIGGYTLDVGEIDPAEVDPVDAIRWESAENVPFVMVDGVPTAYVYFAPAGENFGETADNGRPMRTLGWNEYEIQQVMLALEEYEHILGVDYVITTDVDQATFRLLTTTSDLYGAYAYAQDPEYGTQQGIVVFNVESGGWSFDQQQSLEQGGYSFAVILHEFGHAHGLAHPHDDGGGSDLMLGVSTYTDLGIYDLNQGVYTVMTYNDAWQTGPDGPTPYTGATIDSGWSGTLSAFDIAALQDRYGVHAYSTGNDTYMLSDVADDAFYQTIWDTGGTDSIRYDGSEDARIDLLAATLDYSPTGGGVLSFVDGVYGGYTIANSVTIENATGGSGDDILLGNAGANVLTGNAGDDVLMGRGGADTLNGGAGSDTASYASANSSVTVNLRNGTSRGGDGSDRLSSIENVVGSSFNDSITGSDGANRLDGGAGNDTLTGGRGADVYVFNDSGVDTIVGYERGEDIDLSGLDVTREDVTITADRIVVDLDGDEDLTIMFNTSTFSEGDLFLG